MLSFYAFRFTATDLKTGNTFIALTTNGSRKQGGQVLPEKKSSRKSIRSSERKRQRNITWKSELKTRAKKVAALLDENRPDETQVLSRELISRYDKAANKGIIRKKTAARKKSRLAKKIHQATHAGTGS